MLNDFTLETVHAVCLLATIRANPDLGWTYNHLVTAEVPQFLSFLSRSHLAPRSANVTATSTAWCIERISVVDGIGSRGIGI